MIRYFRFFVDLLLTASAKVVETLRTKLGAGSMSSAEIGCCDHGEDEELGLGSVKFTRGLGRKRILISNKSPVPESAEKSPLKRQRSALVVSNSEKSMLESLPRDLLIRVISGVDHEDLQRLFLVSKSIKEAALIAEETHFAFNTPKKTLAFRDAIDSDEVSSDIEPPKAPIQRRAYRESWTKTKREELSRLSMALFS